ncbi:MAG: HlyC/CorC family transporter [Spirochaetales bacterium]|nr:HlyC/CorC family transporter [Spirochaetales bacterium]
MIRGVVELSDSIVREVMVPRTDVAFLSLGIPEKELLTKVIESGFSRFPVYNETVDNVVGILYAKDLLRIMVEQGPNLDITKIIKQPYFVPETKKLNSLLKEFKRRKVHIAIVVDEFGGTSGIVSLEDIIEEIVGDIQDEFDHETEEILKISEGTYLCDARVNLDDLNERLGLNLPADDFDSLGGFVFDLFGKIPGIQEKMSYNEQLDFVVQRMEGRKILSVKIMMKTSEQENDTQKVLNKKEK